MRVNQMIRVPTVRVVDEEGAQLGVLPTLEALRLAQERGYDLVEVAPMAVPPVVRLLDYGQYKYEAAKKEKEARRHQRSVDFKEIRLKPKIGQGDFDTKVRRAIQFLEDGDRVKVACQFRGRELTHANLGRDLLSKFAEQMKDYGTVERQPLLEGKSMSIVIASNYKPKSQPGSEARAGEDAEPAARGAVTAPAQAAAPQAGAPAGVATAAAAPAAGAPLAPAAATETDVVPGSAEVHGATGHTTASRATARRPAGSTTPGSAGE
ncbi:MAG: translation initiation factor IF-3 [Candidatus Limnocylindrales bacterium]